ncbi:MAG: RNA polymerase sigma factor [Dehalococcoidia bacterium]
MEASAFTATPALAALGELTPEQREVIHLRFVEDLPIHEVARLTGRSAGAVKSLQHRALRQLRSQLSPERPGGPHDA